MSDSIDERVRLLAPRSSEPPLSVWLRERPACAVPFAPERRQLLAAISQSILRHPRLRSDAASVALAFWLRRASIELLARRFLRRAELEPDIVFVPTGGVFHVAPGNVDTIFVYSWALAFLCGNASVVRLSSQISEIVGALLDVLDGLMRADTSFAESNRFIAYGHDDDLNARFSEWAQHRVVWGGDETVARLRAVPWSPHASERSFASKFSYAAFRSRAVLECGDETLTALAQGFFNDIFWFDQMACSSPQIVFWIGEEKDTCAAMDRFYQGLESEIVRRSYRGTEAAATQRFNYAANVLARTEARAELGRPEFLPLMINDRSGLSRDACTNGFFTCFRLDSLSDLVAFVDWQDQTLTHFGFSLDELSAFARAAGARGLDRVVPVGEALAFTPVWDGYDLMEDFLRRVTLRT